MSRTLTSSLMVMFVIVAVFAMLAGCTSSPPSPTPTPTPTPATTQVTTTASGGGGQTVQVTLTAKNILFDKSTITVPAGSTVVITFNNQDSGIPHNFALYTDSSAATNLFRGQMVTGPTTTTYTFTAPSTPGSYFFRCDVHPTVMYGTFVVT